MRTNRACGYLKEQLRAKRSVPSMQILVRVVSPQWLLNLSPAREARVSGLSSARIFCLKGTTAQRKITNSLARIPGS
jgi:hypothetical protein